MWGNRPTPPPPPKGIAHPIPSSTPRSMKAGRARRLPVPFPSNIRRFTSHWPRPQSVRFTPPKGDVALSQNRGTSPKMVARLSLALKATPKWAPSKRHTHTHTHVNPRGSTPWIDESESESQQRVSLVAS